MATITVLLWGTSETILKKVSILSPLQNSSCAITTIICVILLKQEVNIPQIIAIAVIIICMILLSINKDEVLRLESENKEDDEKNVKKHIYYI